MIPESKAQFFSILEMIKSLAEQYYDGSDHGIPPEVDDVLTTCVVSDVRGGTTAYGFLPDTFEDIDAFFERILPRAIEDVPHAVVVGFLSAVWSIAIPKKRSDWQPHHYRAVMGESVEGMPGAEEKITATVIDVLGNVHAEFATITRDPCSIDEWTEDEDGPDPRVVGCIKQCLRSDDRSLKITDIMFEKIMRQIGRDPQEVNDILKGPTSGAERLMRELKSDIESMSEHDRDEVNRHLAVQILPTDTFSPN